MTSELYRRAQQPPSPESFRPPAAVQATARRLHDFAANLFRKPYTKCHQNRQSFMEDITKKYILVSFFLDTQYRLVMGVHSETKIWTISILLERYTESKPHCCYWCITGAGGTISPRIWSDGKLMQIVPLRFCHVSKLQAPDCMLKASACK